MIERRLQRAMHESLSVVGRRAAALVSLCTALAAVLYVLGG